MSTVQVTKDQGWTEVALHTHGCSIAFQFQEGEPPMCKIFVQGGPQCTGPFEFGPYPFVQSGSNPLKVMISDEHGDLNEITDKNDELANALLEAGWTG